MNWLKKLFCKHEWVAYDRTDWYWVEYRCTKCKAHKTELKWYWTRYKCKKCGKVIDRL